MGTRGPARPAGNALAVGRAELPPGNDTSRRDFWVWGSENHHAQAWSSFWVPPRYSPAIPTTGGGATRTGPRRPTWPRLFSEYFIRYARHRAATGLLVECNSDYNKYTLGGWYNMADFAAIRDCGGR